MGRRPENPERHWSIHEQKRMLAERREGKAHQVASALDECLTLLLLALLQAERTPRGMQARRARRLRAKFTNLRLAALEGQSPCDPSSTKLEVLDEAVEDRHYLVK